jgi:hypothetical protein
MVDLKERISKMTDFQKIIFFILAFLVAYWVLYFLTFFAVLLGMPWPFGEMPWPFPWGSWPLNFFK